MLRSCGSEDNRVSRSIPSETGKPYGTRNEPIGQVCALASSAPGPKSSFKSMSIQVTVQSMLRTIGIRKIGMGFTTSFLDIIA